MLGLTAVRVGVLCRQGRFDGAEKIGRNWVIPREAVDNFRRLPPGGRKNLKHQREEDRELIARTLEKLKGRKSNDEQ